METFINCDKKKIKKYFGLLFTTIKKKLYIHYQNNTHKHKSTSTTTSHTTIYIVFQGQKQHFRPPAGPFVLIRHPRYNHHIYIQNLTEGPFHVQHLSSNTQILAERGVNKEFHESLPNYIFFHLYSSISVYFICLSCILLLLFWLKKRQKKLKARKIREK